MTTELSSIESNIDQQDRLRSLLEWDLGTAYDLLMSANTLMNPREHGIPAPWAAGVRKRLSTARQHDFKEFYGSPYSYSTYTPIHLVLEMDAPKDARRFLDFVEAIPADEFSRRMLMPLISDEKIEGITRRALQGERIKEREIDIYRRGPVRLGRSPGSAVEVRRLFSQMADPEGTRERWLGVMREYYTVFFAEEEKREKPALERMLSEAQKLSKETTISDMLERVSHGFSLSEDIDLSRLILAPTIWMHPFTMRLEVAEQELLVLWGALPSGYKLVPGEQVPDGAMLVLRALGDPTRLRLLRLIAAEPRSLQSLAQEVKLSLPTVSHHIRELRGAGLIRLEEAGRGRESKYTVRWPSAQQAFRELEAFVVPRASDGG
jgi:DNA-binding transcriptional ArsR family regulator